MRACCVALGVMVWLFRAAPVQAQCAGDCDASGAVAVNELVLGVNIVLDRAVLDSCTSLDGDDNGRIAVNELVAAVNNALRGCGFARRYTATVDLDGGQSGDIELFAKSNGQATGTLVIRESDEGQGHGTSAIDLSGDFDPVTGAFLVTGSFPGPNGAITVRLSGQLGAGFTLEIDGSNYSGSFATAATPTLTPTATRIGTHSTPTSTPTRTSTASSTIAIPTFTPTPETIGGVSSRLLGFFSGTVTIGTQTYSGRLQILVDDVGPVATDLSMPVPFIFPNPVRMEVITPTELLFEIEGPPLVRFSLTLNEAQHVVGRYTVDDPIMPRLPTDYDLIREP